MCAKMIDVSKLETIEENRKLSETEKLNRLKKVKGGTWYDGWRPYCLNCSSSDRMQQTDFGFRCPCCGNLIGFNLTRLQESPLNNLV